MTVNDAESLPPSPPAVSILPNAPDTFCTYLARQFIGKRGFSENVFPEAAPLAQHCDILLSYSDGYSTGMMCIVDREAHPGKTFDMTPDEVKAVGKECLKYSGSVYGNKIPIALQIMEVGPSEEDASQRARLCHFSPGWFSRVQPAGWVIDPVKKQLWTNARFGGRTAGAALIRELMEKPREDVSQLQPPPTVAASAAGEMGFPYLTVAIIAVLCALFLAEVLFGIGPVTGLLQPSIETLLTFGGIYRPLVINNGEWTRLFSGPLLHVGLEHLALNCIALYIAGRILEGLVGRAWLAAIFVVGALGGSLFSLTLNPDNLVSVGASGAVMGLFAALLMLSFHFPKGADRTALRMTSIYVLIPSMLPIATTGGGKVDIAAHLGGALAGLVVGLVMLPLWPKDEMRPRLAPVATAVGVIGLALFAFAFTKLPDNHRKATFTASLIPSADFPKSDEEADKRSAELVEKYPRDPRSHYFRAIALWNQNDKAGAEKALRAGLADEASWRPLMIPEVTIRLHVALAILEDEDGRKAQAKQTAKVACELAKPDNPQREFLDKYQLCAP
jgi:rhomboid protease GluP